MKDIRLATICCFIAALLEDHDSTDEVRNIRAKCIAYIPTGSQELNIVANEAWALACEYPGQPEWNPALVAILMFQHSKYVMKLQEEAGLRWKYFDKLSKRYDTTLKAKLNSLKIARYNIEAINKTLYTHKDIL